MKFLKPLTIKNLALKNRIVMPPMCTFSAAQGARATTRHLVHYASRAAGGTALIIIEATGVLPEGRITDGCLGLWENSQIEGLAKIVEACHAEGAKVALQLNHAGRKCAACEDQEDYTLAPSALAFNETYRVPRAMTVKDMDRIRTAFQEAASRAHASGFDAVEIHAAHGFLLSSFLSPVSNQREDEYGGSLDNRARFPLEVIRAVREVWPAEKALLLRLSATDYLPGGTGIEETVWFVNQARSCIDAAHLSSGGIAPAPIEVFPGYQVPFAERVKRDCGLPVIAVGAIRRVEEVEEILGNGRADLVALGKELLRNPSWVAQAAWENGMEFPWPDLSQAAFVR